ncbi:putative gustatory receptor 98a [Drosophila madeirensis]|uniref:Gustatory receptor 98a n=1 Tax=Drosophila madeirensis TaxID=30013 RepID=A0AAU9FA82_DROMD
MRKMSGDLYSCSLRHMHRAMKCLGIVPLGQHFYLKILCNLVMVVVISIAILWRFSFKYEFGYDFLNDHMSRVIDLSNFVELMSWRYSGAIGALTSSSIWSRSCTTCESTWAER